MAGTNGVCLAGWDRLTVAFAQSIDWECAHFLMLY
jgi:hypothetical protein